jgi:DivIVA domain-containing protein
MTPVTEREVRAVVFRVRFGGYDRWPVDVYLANVLRHTQALTATRRPPRRDVTDG